MITRAELARWHSTQSSMSDRIVMSKRLLAALDAADGLRAWVGRNFKRGCNCVTCVDIEPLLARYDAAVEKP